MAHSLKILDSGTYFNATSIVNIIPHLQVGTFTCVDQVVSIDIKAMGMHFHIELCFGNKSSSCFVPR